MILTTIDIIVRRALLENGLPIHWYAEFLYHASTALRELSFDTLQIVNTRNLAVNEYGAADLPDDYSDEIAVCLSAGQRIVPLPHLDNINRIRVNNEDTGAFEPYTNTNTNSNGEQVDSSLFFAGTGWVWFWNVNDWGEGTGRFFGANGGSQFGYDIFPERRQIQLTGGVTEGNVILQYISDGQNADSASQISTMAIQAIRAFQEWKRSPEPNNEFSAEGRHWHNQRRLLRARLSSLTIVDIKNILRSNYSASIKT